MNVPLRIILIAATLLGCNQEDNLVPWEMVAASCPLTADEVLANATTTTEFANAEEAAAFNDAVLGWQVAPQGGLRDLVAAEEAESVAIRAEGQATSALTATRVQFDNTSFDRTALHEQEPRWADVDDLPCDYVVLSADVTLVLQFDDGTPLTVPGQWRMQLGAHPDPLTFTGQRAQAVLAPLHPVFANQTTPINLEVWIAGAADADFYGTFSDAQGTLAAYGHLEAMAD